MKQTSVKQQLDKRFRRIQLISFGVIVGISLVAYLFFKFTAQHPVDTHFAMESNETSTPLEHSSSMIADTFAHKVQMAYAPYCKVSTNRDEIKIHIEGNNQLITDFINGNEKLCDLNMESHRCEIKLQKAQNMLDARFAIDRKNGIAYVKIPNDIVFKLTDKLIALP